MPAADTPAPSPHRARLANLAALPLLPTTVDTLLRSVESPQHDALASCAQRDPALLAHLLRRREDLAPIANLATAMTVRDALAELAAPFAAGMISEGASFDGGPHDAAAGIVWPRAVRTACLAEAIAGMAGSADDARSAHEAQACRMLGLLLDIGSLALYRLDPAGYGAILREHGASLAALLEAERAHFGMTHSLAGRIVADAWELPAMVRRHIWFQYQPRPAPDTGGNPSAIPVALHWARRIVWGLHGDALEEPAQALSASASALHGAVESAGDRAKALMQSAPPCPTESEAFRARLGAYIATASRSTTREELEWAEQALMAGEAELPGPSQAAAAPMPPLDAAARMAQALKAPIGRITAHANRLLTESGGADPALLRAIHEQGQIAERVLHDVIACSQPVPLHPEPVLLNYFLKQFFQGVSSQLRLQGVRIEWRLSEGLPRVLLDRAAIEQVLHNLTVNAVQAMGEFGGILTISTRTEGSQGIVVTLEDSGKGLDPALAGDAAFEPMVTGTQGGSGPGLGLTAARALMTAQGGAITLEPGKEGGIVCTLRLPVAASNADTASPPPAKPDHAAPPSPPERPILQVVDVQAKPLDSASLRPEPAVSPAEQGGGAPESDPKRLLMADTDFELGELLQELLGRRGFEVAYCREPASAIAEAVAGEPFGQILVDGALFAPDGRPLAQALHELLPAARIILTESAGMAAMTGLEGVNLLRLVKPFPVRALLAALQPDAVMRGR